MYDFDEIVERRGTGSFKHDNLKEFFGRDNLVPLWLAMDCFLKPDEKVVIQTPAPSSAPP